MPKALRRGYEPGDEEAFSPAALELLGEAALDYAFLLERGYPAPGAREVVGNRRQLTRRQRLFLARAVCAAADARARRARQALRFPLPGDAVLSVDGFNVIITLEVLLSGSPVIRCRDGALRDLAGLRGTYRLIAHTPAAVELMLDALKELKPRRTGIWLDAPVSNSGRLKALVEERAGQRGLPVDVYLQGGVDRELAGHPLVATCDAAIMDRCGAWLNLPALALPRVAGCWEIGLRGVWDSGGAGNFYNGCPESRRADADL